MIDEELSLKSLGLEELVDLSKCEGNLLDDSASLDVTYDFDFKASDGNVENINLLNVPPIDHGLFFSGYMEYPRVVLPRHIVFFDLDETIFTLLSTLKHNEATSGRYPCLTPVADVCFIYLEKMAQIFRDFQFAGIEIAFITSGLYEGPTVKKFLEFAYDLFPGSLAHCMYVNRNDYGGLTVSKGAKLAHLRRLGFFAERDRVTLVDDHEINIASAKEYGFSTVLATGFTRRYIDSSYNKYTILTANSSYLTALEVLAAQFVVTSGASMPSYKL